MSSESRPVKLGSATATGSGLATGAGAGTGTGSGTAFAVPGMALRATAARQHTARATRLCVFMFEEQERKSWDIKSVGGGRGRLDSWHGLRVVDRERERKGWVAALHARMVVGLGGCWQSSSDGQVGGCGDGIVV
ncbi:hypothetical protein BCR44DRAFT_1451375, partial [Catenaria anguillulae PL171]